MSDPLSDKCAYCGSSDVLDDAWFCGHAGCHYAYQLDGKVDFALRVIKTLVERYDPGGADWELALSLGRNGSAMVREALALRDDPL